MKFRLFNLQAVEGVIASELPLKATALVLEAVAGPIEQSTPEERAFSLAVEVNDPTVAGASMERILARRSNSLPLSVKALWFRVAKSLQRQDAGATRELLVQIATYFR